MGVPARLADAQPSTSAARMSNMSDASAQLARLRIPMQQVAKILASSVPLPAGLRRYLEANPAPPPWIPKPAKVAIRSPQQRIANLRAWARHKQAHLKTREWHYQRQKALILSFQWHRRRLQRQIAQLKRGSSVSGLGATPAAQIRALKAQLAKLQAGINGYKRKQAAAQSTIGRLKRDLAALQREFTKLRRAAA